VWPHLDASEGRSKLTREGRDGAGEATEGGLGSLRPESAITTRFGGHRANPFMIEKIQSGAFLHPEVQRTGHVVEAMRFGKQGLA